MARNYAGADLFILPSQEDNLPNTVVESLACGTPLAAFAVGGVPEMIVDGVTGRLTPGGQADALAVLLREIAANPAAIKSMRSRCRAYAEKHFDIRVNTQAVVKHYHQVHVPARRTRTQNLGDFPGPALAGFLETPNREILGLRPSEFLTRVTNLADRTEVEQIFATTRQQTEFIEVLRNERTRLTAEAEAARAEATRAISDGQKHIDKAMQQLEQQSVESQGHIDALKTQLDRTVDENARTISSLKQQLDQFVTASSGQTDYIRVLERERDRLTAETKAAQTEANRASRDGQKHIDTLMAQLNQLAATSAEQAKYIKVLESERDRLTAECARMLEVVRDENSGRRP